MGAPSNSSSNTNDVIDLISDEDEENESQHMEKTLEDLYELASLRSLIPPNFLLRTLDSDFNFFNKELALSLMSISRNQTQTIENRNVLPPDPSKSTPTIVPSTSSTTSTSVNNSSTINSGSPVIESTKSRLTIKPVPASIPVQSQPSNGGTSNHTNSVNNLSITTKLPNGLYRVSQSNLSIQNSKKTASITNKKVLNGVVAGTSPASSQPSELSKGSDNIRNKMVLNGVATTASTSSVSNQSNNLLSKLASSKAFENLKTTDTVAQKSITINGFTITSTVNNTNSTAAPSPEVRRKLPIANYSCDKCHEKFRYNIALLDHLSSVHKISVDTVSHDTNSSSQSIKTKKSVKKQRRSKKESVKKIPLSVAEKHNSKVKKAKRKNSTECNDVASKKASMSAEITSKRSSVENSAENSPKTVSEPQLLDNTTYSVPKIERIESSPSPISNSETSMNDASDNLVMDITEENESNDSNNDSDANIFSDASSKITNVDEYMKSFKFLTYFEIENNDSIRYRCSTCSKSCIAIELVLDHSEKCSGRKSLKCLFPNCSSAQVTFVPQQLKEHLKSKHNILTHSCKVCKSYFVQAEELKVHRISCVNYENSQYQCPVEGCKEAYFYEMHFRGHLSRRHKIITIFTCKVCKLFFHDEEDLNSHLKTSAHVAADVERMRKLKELHKKMEKKAAEKKAE